MSNNLPHPDDPIELTNNGGKVFLKLPSRGEAEQIVHRTYAKLASLPAPPAQTNPISVVIAYELFGLSDEDIAIAMKLTVPQVNQIKHNEAYKTIKSQIVSNIINEGKNSVKDLFVKHQTKAAEKIIETIDSPRGALALQASKLVLGASGVSLEAKGEPIDQMSVGLQIIIVEKDNALVPETNLDLTVIADG